MILGESQWRLLGACLEGLERGEAVVCVVVLCVSLSPWATNSDPHRAGWGGGKECPQSSSLIHGEGDHTR